MIVKLLTEHHLEATEAHMSLHMSKCHIVEKSHALAHIIVGVDMIPTLIRRIYACICLKKIIIKIQKTTMQTYFASLCVHSSFAITSMGKRELVALLCSSSWCLVIAVWLYLTICHGFICSL